jgi:phosphotriesterase-related protein
MTTVETVTGSVSVESLGTTLMHEHVFVLTPELEQNYDVGWDEEARVADAIERLNDLHAVGVDTIVDLTVIGLGRYIPRIQRIAAATDLRIIVATGLYTYNDLPRYFELRRAEAMAELFVRDIDVGIGETGVRAGILKCATDQAGLTPGVEKTLRAVAMAHRRTGVPISTHTHAASQQGLAQQRIFTEEGTDLSRVVIGHSGDTEDLAYLDALMAAGSYIGMDRFGIDSYLSLEQRVNVVASLCERGRADRMVLSQDASCYIDWYNERVLHDTLPDWHFRHLMWNVLPALRTRGVTEEQIHQMLVLNPRAIFSVAGGY